MPPPGGLPWKRREVEMNFPTKKSSRGFLRRFSDLVDEFGACEEIEIAVGIAECPLERAVAVAVAENLRAHRSLEMRQ